MLLDKELLERYVEEGYLRKAEHPTLDLTIYNYTVKAQYEPLWDDVTLTCRGLVMNSKGEIIVKPMRKFFNIGELKVPLPTGPVTVTEKMDGSLGFVFKYQNQLVFASRGSFTSDQAVELEKIFYEKPFSKTGVWHPEEGTTLVFEIIYPENRIVVNYGDLREIVLLTVIENGVEVELDSTIYKDFYTTVKSYGFTSLEDVLAAPQADNKEGFVVRWENGFRVKVKFDEYCRLHKILTNTSSITVWEALKEGTPILEFLEDVPDEFYTFVHDTIIDLQTAFTLKKIEAETYAARVEDQKLPDRKAQAAWIMENVPKAFQGFTFAILDGKDISRQIWPLIRPKHELPFSNDNNDS